MTDSTEPTQPTTPLARARRRRARRTYFPKDAEGRAAVLAALSRRAYPSFDLFIFSLLCGAVVGIGYLFDSHGVLVLGILFAPLMTPWVGLLLAAISGTPRLFFQTLVGLLISALLVFLTGLITGLASQIFPPLTFTQAFNHSHLWWPDLIVLAFGAVLLTASFVRSEEKPYLPSAIVAYELFLPLGAGGLGLGSGVGSLWPQGLFVFFVHLAWATLFGLLTLAVLRFRPLTVGGYFFGAGIFAAVGITVIWLMLTNQPQSIPVAEPLVSPTLTLTSSPIPPQTEMVRSSPPPPSTSILPTVTRTATSTDVVTPVPLTLDVTLPVTETPTTTPSPQPTPVYATIKSPEGGGARIRKTPGGVVIATLTNGSIVQVLPDTLEYNGATWVRIIITNNEIKVDGWIIQSLLEMPTPVPNWEPSTTPVGKLHLDHS